MRNREGRKDRTVSDLIRDLRFAARTLIRRPGFTATAVLTLALGIGSNTAVFAVVHGVLLQPLGFPEPDRIVAIWAERFAGNREIDFFRKNAVSYESVSAWSPGWGSAVTGIDEPTQVDAARVSANFFDVVGVRPQLGRGFLPG